MCVLFRLKYVYAGRRVRRPLRSIYDTVYAAPTTHFLTLTSELLRGLCHYLDAVVFHTAYKQSHRHYRNNERRLNSEAQSCFLCTEQCASSQHIIEPDIPVSREEFSDRKNAAAEHILRHEYTAEEAHTESERLCYQSDDVLA